jgi:5-formyltetrahydrofolate cyclo-ligase
LQPTEIRRKDFRKGQAAMPDASPVPPEPIPGSSDWQAVRSWRKAQREILIASRLALTSAERIAHAAAVTRSLRQVLDRASTGVLAFYWPFKGEYDPRRLVRDLRKSGARLALPVVVEKGRPLEFRAWHPGAAMVDGIWNIPIPASGGVLVPNTLLVPLVGFDQHGFRLGYGGGYYDRTLAALSPRPRTIAIGHALSAMPTIYPQPHDIPMDVVITEQQTRSFRCR